MRDVEVRGGGKRGEEGGGERRTEGVDVKGEERKAWSSRTNREKSF